jgi:hypothetical protein
VNAENSVVSISRSVILLPSYQPGISCKRSSQKLVEHNDLKSYLWSTIQDIHANNIPRERIRCRDRRLATTSAREMGDRISRTKISMGIGYMRSVWVHTAAGLVDIWQTCLSPGWDRLISTFFAKLSMLLSNNISQYSFATDLHCGDRKSVV